MGALLEVKNLNVYYGVIHALKDVSFHVNKGEVVALIGANGAGKTTTLHTLSGLLRPQSGSILYQDKEIARMPGHKIVSMGMAQVPEGRRVFADLTVEQNLRLGAFTRKDKNEIEETISMVYERFPRLKEREKQIAGTLSGGEQQMLAMGRGLMSSPELILLDEPSLGLAPLLINTIFEIIKEIKAMGKTILLVEQNAFKALSVADEAYVLEQGVITASGKASDLIKDPKIQEAYLGKK